MTSRDDLCMGCMEPRGPGRTCPHCGWEEGSPQSSPTFLPARTVLNGRYILGRVLGAGGFGITYLAWDLDLDFKLAIKEYFPNSFGARNRDHSTVIPANTQSKDAFEHGLKKFLDEGKALARFQGHPSIASVMTFLRENGTSYLVMKYEDGITLQEYLKQHGGRLDFDTVMRIAMPILDALRAVHQEGILHRDISPDNIIVNRSRQIKILDFGSAKRDMTAKDSTLQITLKRGFSPEEQYRANGRQGAWTDVYAVGATLYQCLTGSKPPDALERLSDDALVSPIQCGVKMPKDAEKALLKALAVRAPNRFQTIDEFREALNVPVPHPGLLERLRESLGPLLTAALAKVRANIRMISWTAGAALLLLVLLRLVPSLLIAPEIREFAIDRTAVAPGEAANLRWSTSAGKVEILPGIGSISQGAGTRQVFPKADTTYTLTARAALRSTTRSVKVAVTGTGRSGAVLPLDVHFTAEPLTVKPGASTELVWSIGGHPTAVTIDQGIGAVESSGRRKLTPTANSTYTLRAESAPGVAVQGSVTVLLEAVVPRPVITALAADPPTIRRGQTAHLSWQVTGDNTLLTFDHDIGRVKARDSLTVQPFATTQYKLTARNPGGSVTKAVSVEVVEPDPPRITSFTARPENITAGQNSGLSWAVSGEVTSVAISPAVGSVQSEGRHAVSPTATTTYTLSATGPGGTVTQDAIIRVAAARAPVITFTATPAVVLPRQTVTLSWKVEGDVTSVIMDPGATPEKAESSAVLQPTQNVTFTLTATGPGGKRSKQVEIRVSNEPVEIADFKVTPPKGKTADAVSIKHGESATLSWKVTGPVTDVSIEPGNLRGPGIGSQEVRPDKTTEYVLTPHAGNLVFASRKVKITVKK